MLKLLITWGALTFCGAVWAGQNDDFLAAREAFRVGDGVKFERSARSLNGYVLEPYILYWRLKLRLDSATPDEVRALLTRLADGPLSDRLRADWLRILGSHQQWELFEAEYRDSLPDTDLLCYSLQNRLRKSIEAAPDARKVWFTGADLPDSCNTLFDTLVASQKLTTEDVWARIRLALEAGNTSVVRRIAEYLPAAEQPDGRQLSAIAVNPQAFFDKQNFNLKTRAGRETVMYAAHRLARTSPQLAATQWGKVDERFTPEERGYVWGLIAFNGAQRLDPNALRWYAQASELSDPERAWKVRAALRVQNWREVLGAIDGMSAKESQDPAWRYWKARALKALGRPNEAQVLLEPLATEFNFYGQLALDELGTRKPVLEAAYKPSRLDVQTVSTVPGIQRALAFYALNLTFEGAREWNWAMRDLTDQQLLAAAELAKRNSLYDRAIYSADRTKDQHDFSMRYLAPYRDVMKGYVAQQQLDEAWVYGLIRQESRFVATARSSAGAAGLMQLMPATARWVAKKAGFKDYRNPQTSDVETNINLGTWYLKHVFDTLDSQPVLASAAYNAGPGRARGWRADSPMEGAIYAETIPFNETRDYVKKVMSNASYYGNQFGQTLQSLKQRIGVIAPRSRSGEKPLDEPGG